MATPPGDEIWAQKCHELDFQVNVSNKSLFANFHFFTNFEQYRDLGMTLNINDLVPDSSPFSQVALLKEERSNLLVENEDLCEKVRAAQTLSRKVSSIAILVKR